jgi:ABC-type nitrate/sulfonate/bicarbonate transport system substrate-binding protein
VAVLARALAAAGCGIRAAGSPGSAQPPIVIGVLPAIGSAPVFIAQDEGLFTKAGLRVTVKTHDLSGVAGAD